MFELLIRCSYALLLVISWAFITSSCLPLALSFRDPLTAIISHSPFLCFVLTSNLKEWLDDCKDFSIWARTIGRSSFRKRDVISFPIISVDSNPNTFLTDELM